MAISIKVADEVWIGCALLHYENPHCEDFATEEIVGRVARENIFGTLRPGVRVHVNQHCVANRPANPGNYRMLYETRLGYRRLWRLGDDFHPSREYGKICPEASDIPVKYHFLLEWYRKWATDTGSSSISRGVCLRENIMTLSRHRAAPVEDESGVTEACASELSTVSEAREFEVHARRRMSEFFGVELNPGTYSNIPKKFDMVSPDRSIIGDAKYYTLVRGTQIPPAKFSIISEHVWLLEKTDSKIKFLVFGNDRRVPEEWLARYGHLVTNVQFFFLDPQNGVLKLK
ncbi:hypothetical protein Desku_1044 [Desulfofundulus kuznetsovii DSM 6115]|uniref:Uncharacterized protein n=1 Tax=Desulfofundulus kuznetsovii (strain DSM 6115 / VKM B-1805 / 17) TaxID=760568 RepID=A0AAU8PUR0_DESK7|nr:hypothetical protein Desku_1044 [Desulfofundulus kuznetsovii DSM 6115]